MVGLPRASLLVPTIALAAGHAFAQSTLAVPAAFATIQAAIVAAAPGDTVLVSPGTYAERIDFLGKSIVVRSVAGAAVTTIDGGQGGTVVTFASGEPPAAVLEGFTIGNGLGGVLAIGNPPRSAPGGILCVAASPTVRGCVISGNQGGAGVSPAGAVQLAGAGGPGGVLALASALRLIDCDVVDNTGGTGGTAGPGPLGGANGGRGGAGGACLQFTVAGSTPELVRCRFRDNVGGDGGGLLPTVPSGSGGRGGDGGFELFASVPVQLTHCEIRGNVGGDGADVAGNDGLGGNGGFDVAAPFAFAVVAARMTNCAVVGNTGGNALGAFNAYGGHGGGATGATQFTAIASTFAGNATGSPLLPGAGVGGLAVGGFMISTATLRNCVLWHNTRLGVPSDLDVSGIAASVANCDVGATNGTTFGGGNLSVDPLFVDLASGDVHLTAGSPCRHAGADVPSLPLFDLDGDPRTVGPAPDMGADEWDGLVGSREDFVLALTVDGTAQPAVVASTAVANDTVAVHVTSPGGTLAGTLAVVGLESWLPPNAPAGPVLLPELHLSPAAFPLLFAPAGVGAGGLTIATSIPPGLGGLAVRVQAFALTGAARNGTFAATAARDVIL